MVTSPFFRGSHPQNMFFLTATRTLNLDRWGQRHNFVLFCTTKRELCATPQVPFFGGNTPKTRPSSDRRSALYDRSFVYTEDGLTPKTYLGVRPPKKWTWGVAQNSRFVAQNSTQLCRCPHTSR
jgi:hypothetical protein